MDQRPESPGPAIAPTRGLALIRRIAGPIWQLVGIAYLRGSGRIKRDFERRPDAADHPVFRLDPLPGP